jgi:hypothetical protein
MSMETKRPTGPHSAPGDNYEKTDANVKGILMSGFWLAVILVVVFLAMWKTFYVMGRMEPMGKAASPFATERPVPPAPRLQVDPQTEIHSYCAAQMQALTTYQWKDQQAGIAQIPVDRAMDLIVQRGLPARAAGSAPTGIDTAEPPVPQSADVTGQCGYVTEHDAEKAAEAEELEKPSKE